MSYRGAKLCCWGFIHGHTTDEVAVGLGPMSASHQGTHSARVEASEPRLARVPLGPQQVGEGADQQPSPLQAWSLRACQVPTPLGSRGPWGDS